jgi:hypothetical protein
MVPMSCWPTVGPLGAQALLAHMELRPVNPHVEPTNSRLKNVRAQSSQSSLKMAPSAHRLPRFLEPSGFGTALMLLLSQ